VSGENNKLTLSASLPSCHGAQHSILSDIPFEKWSIVPAR
jgi:hypothetical protein